LVGFANFPSLSSVFSIIHSANIYWVPMLCQPLCQELGPKQQLH
jgi:hypothetical protein